MSSSEKSSDNIERILSLASTITSEDSDFVGNDFDFISAMTSSLMRIDYSQEDIEQFVRFFAQTSSHTTPKDPHHGFRLPHFSRLLINCYIKKNPTSNVIIDGKGVQFDYLFLGSGRVNNVELRNLNGKMIFGYSGFQDSGSSSLGEIVFRNCHGYALGQNIGHGERYKKVTFIGCSGRRIGAGIGRYCSEPGPVDFISCNGNYIGLDSEASVINMNNCSGKHLGLSPMTDNVYVDGRKVKFKLVKEIALHLLEKVHLY